MLIHSCEDRRVDENYVAPKVQVGSEAATTLSMHTETQTSGHIW